MNTIHDAPTVSREELLCERFEHMRLTLQKNKAGLLDTSADVLALDTLELLARVLRSGHPSQKMLALLADYLDDVIHTANRSGVAWDVAVKSAYRILGHQPNGRPNNIRAISRAVVAFDFHYDEGKGISVAEAECAAHDAYQAALGHPEKTYEASKARQVSVTRGAEVVIMTEAERLLDSTIRPALRKAGLLPSAPKGRKPKSKAKPHP